MSCITRKPFFCLLDLPHSLCSNQSDAGTGLNQSYAGTGLVQSDAEIDINQPDTGIDLNPSEANIDPKVLDAGIYPKQSEVVFLLVKTLETVYGKKHCTNQIFNL